ncbi:MAG: hypothetical protein ABI955_10505, partial [Nitrospirota bacterium]
VARCPPCSQNAHDKNVLVRCAQSRATLATPLPIQWDRTGKKKSGLAIPRARATRGLQRPSLNAHTLG